MISGGVVPAAASHRQTDTSELVRQGKTSNRNIPRQSKGVFLVVLLEKA